MHYINSESPQQQKGRLDVSLDALWLHYRGFLHGGEVGKHITVKDFSPIWSKKPCTEEQTVATGCIVFMLEEHAEEL